MCVSTKMLLQAAKIWLIDLGYSKAEGAYPFVDGQYVRGYSFEAGALDKNQTFTIPYADLFKAYCFDSQFKKLIDSGKFILQIVILFSITRNTQREISLGMLRCQNMLSRTWMSAVSSSQRDIAINRNIKGKVLHTVYAECRTVENQVEYSFEINAHNKTLLEQIKNAKHRSEAAFARG